MRLIEVAAVGVIALVTAAGAVVDPLLGGLVAAASAVAVRWYDHRRQVATLRRIAALEPRSDAFIDELQRYSAWPDGRLP